MEYARATLDSRNLDYHCPRVLAAQPTPAPAQRNTRNFDRFPDGQIRDRWESRPAGRGRANGDDFLTGRAVSIFPAASHRIKLDLDAPKHSGTKIAAQEANCCAGAPARSVAAQNVSFALCAVLATEAASAFGGCAPEVPRPAQAPQILPTRVYRARSLPRAETVM